MKYYDKNDEISFFETDDDFQLYLSSLLDNEQITSILLNL
tara:strand:- start:389 stop:508 length:120 start_codon:yes stop_codon:yes gene_type:complete